MASPSNADVCGCNGHLVQFYEDDAFLIRAVAEFLQQGFETGGNGIVIATAAHLAELAAALQAAGLDVAQLRAQGRYRALDARETLERILSRDGVVDAGLFDRVLGGAISELTSGRGPLRAFGEMVTLLWREGKPEESLRLEEMWNGLLKRQAFELYCAYPIQVFGRSESARRFQQVCRAHTRVLPTETFTPQAGLSDEQLRQVAVLQQRAAVLEAEIEERRRVEATLRRRDAELTAFVETAAIGLHWVDAGGIITWANQAQMEMLGYGYDEYVGRHVAEFHVDQPAIADILARLQRGEPIRDCEVRMRAKDGSIKVALIDSTALWDEGRFVHSQCFIRDVTAQRRSEQAMRHMAAIVDGSDDAILSKDLDGIVTSWNLAAQRMFGYGADEMIGQSIVRLIPPDRRDEEEMILARLRCGERIVHYETRRRRKDGTLLDVSLTISPVRDAMGQIVGASKIARDITEKKAAKDELARMNRELEQRVQERTASLTDLLVQMETFSYTVSHDLRAPLRAMSGYARVLLEDHGAALNDEMRHYVERILRASDRMNRMTSDVLAYARVNRDRLELKPVSLAECIRQVTHHAAELQPPHAIVSVAPGMPTVLGNETFLTQIFANLLGNAVKFVPRGRVPEVRIGFERQGEFVRVLVTDNGIGIKPEHQSRLFALFERLHHEREYNGTGIGLAIVRRAVERMGGTVGIESDGENGSQFWFTLRAVK